MFLASVKFLTYHWPWRFAAMLTRTYHWSLSWCEWSGRLSTVL